MKIYLEHNEIIRAISLYIREVYGPAAISTLNITAIRPGDKIGGYSGPPAYQLEADITMPEPKSEL